MYVYKVGKHEILFILSASNSQPFLLLMFQLWINPEMIIYFLSNYNVISVIVFKLSAFFYKTNVLLQQHETYMKDK